MMKDINYALMLLRSNKFEGAMEILEELLQSDPVNQDVLYNLGMCYTELGRPKKAIEMLTECVQHYPHYSNAYVALGYAYSRISDNNRAKESFLAALEVEPSNPYALRSLGGLYGKERDYEKSIDCFEKSFSINPNDQQTAYGLGLNYFNIGEIEKADKYFKTAINLDESSSTASAAKDFRRKIAEIKLKSKGFRPDTMFYCLGALQFFKDKKPEQIRQIVFEIGMKGRKGLDIDNPDKKYTLDSMDGIFTGLQLVSYMYVGFKMIDPVIDVGIDLSQEYEEALKLFNKAIPDDHTIH